MKKMISIFCSLVAVAFVSACSSTATQQASNENTTMQRVPASNGVHLEGDAARDFIEKYLPQADVPGTVSALINCSYPAMGAASEGAQPVCDINLN